MARLVVGFAVQRITACVDIFGIRLNTSPNELAVESVVKALMRAERHLGSEERVQGRLVNVSRSGSRVGERVEFHNIIDTFDILTEQYVETGGEGFVEANIAAVENGFTRRDVDHVIR